MHYVSLAQIEAPHWSLMLLVASLIGLNLLIILGHMRGMTVAQFGLYLLNLCFANGWWRLTTIGHWPQELFPAQGYIIIANHRSSIDPMLIQSSIPRPLAWMIAREYTEVPVMGWLLRIIGVIPVTRDGSDRSSIRESVAALQAGKWIGIFPEGEINLTDEPLLEFHAGVALMAQRANVPVIPCWIHNAPYRGSVLGAIFIRCRTRLYIGEPIAISAKAARGSKGLAGGDDLATITQRLHAAVLSLRPT